MNIEALYLIGVFILVFVVIGLIAVMGRRNDAQDDEALAESLSRYSEAKMARKDVPIMLRKQAD